MCEAVHVCVSTSSMSLYKFSNRRNKIGNSRNAYRDFDLKNHPCEDYGEASQFHYALPSRIANECRNRSFNNKANEAS